MEWQQRVIDEVYGGDRKRFDQEYAAVIEEANATAISWDDLIRSATVLVRFEQEAKECIEEFLGYLPDTSVTITYEPFLRSLIQHKSAALIAPEQFDKLAEEHIRLIRNEDVRFNVCHNYDKDLYDMYHQQWLPYGPTVRERVIEMLGYSPDLDCSLLAELYLRKVIANDCIHLSDIITAVDYKALTLIRYREILVSQGKQAADNSPLYKTQRNDRNP